MIRPQYHFRPGPEGLYAWNVARLIREARDIPVRSVPLDDIVELDECYWGVGQIPLTVRAIARHADLIGKADTSVPILLCAEGRVMDGMHRVARGLIDGKLSLPAQRFRKTPDPDAYPADPDQLSYDPADFEI